MVNLRRYSKLGAILLITLLLAGGWYYQVVWNSIKPTLIRTFPSVLAASTPTYSSDQSLLEYRVLGIEAPVTVRPAVSPFDISQWSSLRSDLTKGVALAFSGDSFIDAPHAYLIGHSSDTYPHPYSAIFAGLGQVQNNDTFLLVVEGKPYTYKVISHQVVSPTDVTAFEAPAKQAVAQNTHLISLVTCWPVLTTRNRLMVVAERM